METPVAEYLQEVLDDCGGVDQGAVADYIPELAAANPHQLGAAIATIDGPIYAAGDVEAKFSIQSISKPFAYALALRDHGLDSIMKSVGVEPSGDAFNEISLEPSTGRPRNPMINVGAIVTHSLVGEPNTTAEERDREITAGLSAFAGRPLEVDQAVFDSELGTANRNLSLAYMVRSYDVVTHDPEDLVRGYTRQCSLLVDVRDLAVMAATLANGGTNPITGVQVVEPWVARQVLSVMATCGMYDAAGDWFSSVGIPAKSGVSGGIIGALPGQVGIGTFSPRLDSFGNSARGVQICHRLSHDMGLHLMGAPALAAGVVRRHDSADGAERLDLQGTVHFAAAERVLRELATIEPGDSEVFLDLTRMTELDDTGKRMLEEGIRRLELDGHRVRVEKPDRAEI